MGRDQSINSRFAEIAQRIGHVLEEVAGMVTGEPCDGVGLAGGMRAPPRSIEGASLPAGRGLLVGPLVIVPSVTVRPRPENYVFSCAPRDLLAAILSATPAGTSCRKGTRTRSTDDF